MMTPQQLAMFVTGLQSGAIEAVEKDGRNVGYLWRCCCDKKHLVKRLRSDDPAKMKQQDYVSCKIRECIELRVLRAMRDARMKGCPRGNPRPEDKA